jgi:hypothetical protein
MIEADIYVAPRNMVNLSAFDITESTTATFLRSELLVVPSLAPAGRAFYSSDLE